MPISIKLSIFFCYSKIKFNKLNNFLSKVKSIWQFLRNSPDSSRKMITFIDWQLFRRLKFILIRVLYAFIKVSHETNTSNINILKVKIANTYSSLFIRRKAFFFALRLSLYWNLVMWNLGYCIGKRSLCALGVRILFHFRRGLSVSCWLIE